MPPPIPERELVALENVVRSSPDGVSFGYIQKALKRAIPRRTLQYWLQHLVDTGRLLKEGERRGTKYRLPAAGPPTPVAGEQTAKEDAIPLSAPSLQIRRYLNQNATARKPVGYNRQFLEAYKPNKTPYLSEVERVHLAKVGKPNFADQAAGTYAKHILNRLLIDLSWNSSRLEGNTYSLLDTKRLIEFGEEAQGRDRLEAQMIINHKEAIGFLVGAADEIGFNRHTILNLHGILAQNLLPDPAAAGRLRHIAIGIESSTFQPLELPQLIEECFDRLLATATAINDPFEQAFFVMVQLPYLQPFDDVNKRVSRLAANIPFIKLNLSPLSFTDVPRQVYIDAMLGVYELNKVDLLKEVFVWAYERSAARYAAVRQSLGEPDPFRFKYSDSLRQIVGEVIHGRMNKKNASAHLASWIKKNVIEEDRERFREMAEGELLGLHEGNFARYQVRPSEFQEWQNVWRDGS